ncbi:MAG: tripartite tricarboxylate transporter permease [Rhodothermales bacterium]
MSEALLQALQQVVLSPEVLAIVFFSALYGVFMGSMPGLTATMSVALFIPLTYWLDPIPALAGIVTMVACAIFAGDLPTTLLRIPGTPASAAYVDDAYALTREGRSDLALGTMLVSSVAGGLFGAVVLMTLGHQLARVATFFSIAEYFWLYVLGLSSAVVVSRGALSKASLAMLIGLLLSTVGLSAVHTEARFTFGRPELYQGINFIPAMIGLFGLSEVLNNLVGGTGLGGMTPPSTARRGRSHVRRYLIGPIVDVIKPGFSVVRRRLRHTFRSGVIGSFVGMLPGAGADIASWVSLAASKRASDTPEAYGKGSIDGISDATAANSSALAGTWIPALVFGIPGDSITAIVIGVLLMKNVNPGPDIFLEQAGLVYSIYLIFIVANLVLLPVGLLAVKMGSRVVRVPQKLLMPIILLLCIVGAYAINSSNFDVAVMLGMGLLGFGLERMDVPLGPVVLGIILGAPLEERFIQILTSAGGDPLAFFGRPVAAALGVLCIALWVWAVYSARRDRAA